MQIAKNTVVSLTYRLTNAEGKLIEETDHPISYLHGGYHGIFPGVENALDGQQAGFECDVKLEPEDAFGEYEIRQMLFPLTEPTYGQVAA